MLDFLRIFLEFLLISFHFFHFFSFFFIFFGATKAWEAGPERDGKVCSMLDWNWSTLYIVMRYVAISPTSAHFLLTSTDSQLNSF